MVIVMKRLIRVLFKVIGETGLLVIVYVPLTIPEISTHGMVPSWVSGETMQVSLATTVVVIQVAEVSNYIELQVGNKMAKKG